MSTTTTTAKADDLRRLDDRLNAMILEGKALEGFEKFYADDVEMRENTEPPTVGKEANRKREIEFFDSLAEFHGGAVLATAVGEDVTFSEWAFDVTFKNGTRKKLEQAVVRRWRDGRIVAERFYYNA